MRFSSWNSLTTAERVPRRPTRGRSYLRAQAIPENEENGDRRDLLDELFLKGPGATFRSKIASRGAYSHANVKRPPSGPLVRLHHSGMLPASYTAIRDAAANAATRRSHVATLGVVVWWF